MASCPKCNGKTVKNAQRFQVCPRHGVLQNLVRHALNNPYTPPEPV